MSYLALDSNAWQVSVKINAPILPAIKTICEICLTQFIRINYMRDERAYSYAPDYEGETWPKCYSLRKLSRLSRRAQSFSSQQNPSYRKKAYV